MPSQSLCLSIIVLLLCLSFNAPAVADDLPASWLTCSKTDDCIFVRDNKNCSAAAVNKQYAEQAAQYLSKKEGEGPVRALDRTIRCVNALGTVCEANICVLKVHPE